MKELSNLQNTEEKEIAEQKSEEIIEPLNHELDDELILDDENIMQNGQNSVFGIISVTIGILMIFFMFLPFFNFILAGLGIITGYKGRIENINYGLSTAGLIINIAFMIFSAVFMIFLLIFISTRTINIFNFDFSG